MCINELAELLLAAFFEETETLGRSNYFLFVDEIAANLGVQDRQQVIDACHLLEEKGFILLAYDHVSSLSAFITLAGETHVRAGGETGIIGEYERYRASAAGNSPDSVQDAPVLSSFQPPSVVQTEQESALNEGMRNIIASMELLVGNDPALPENARKDLTTDIKTLEVQLSRSSPKRSIVDTIAAELRTVPGLIPLVDLLLSMKEMD